MTATVNEEATTQLAEEMMRSVRRHYLANGENSRDMVLQVLNALAASTALVLAGTHNAPEAREFFDAALKQNLVAHSS